MQHGSPGSKTGVSSVRRGVLGAARTLPSGHRLLSRPESALLAPPTPSPAEQRAAARADSPRVHTLGPLFSSREAPHASGAFNGNPRRPGNPGRDPGPPGTLRICLAFPAPERLRGELEARARDPNPAFPEEPPLVGWLPSVWARAPHAREV